MKPASYIICTSPRSGSTLLCTMLAATGKAGDPDSLFYLPDLDDWMTRLGVLPGARTGRPLMDAILQAALRQGRGDTPMFGLRQQWPGLAFLCQQLEILYPEASSDRQRLELAFGPTLFIHLTRTDKQAQAVSLIKAQQTGLWHVAPDGSELERTAPARAPEFDAAELGTCVERLTGYDLGWNAWFDAQGIDPLRIAYDDLAAAPSETLRRILGRLGLDATAADRIEPGVRKMADATSRDWLARLREGGPPG